GDDTGGRPELEMCGRKGGIGIPTLVLPRAHVHPIACHDLNVQREGRQKTGARHEGSQCWQNVKRSVEPESAASSQCRKPAGKRQPGNGGAARYPVRGNRLVEPAPIFAISQDRVAKALAAGGPGKLASSP